MKNLLSNAIKFSPDNGVIKISSQDIDDRIEVRVADQGRGIPQKFRQKIFERFQQVRKTDSEKLGGAGLGLAICKAIVTAHRGEIGVADQSETGSVFWFRLPKSQGHGTI